MRCRTCRGRACRTVNHRLPLKPTLVGGPTPTGRCAARAIARFGVGCCTEVIRWSRNDARYREESHGLCTSTTCTARKDCTVQAHVAGRNLHWLKGHRRCAKNAPRLVGRRPCKRWAMAGPRLSRGDIRCDHATARLRQLGLDQSGLETAMVGRQAWSDSSATWAPK